MAKIVDYTVILVEDHRAEFVLQVRSHLHEGWQPYGPPVITPDAPNITYVQTMVIYDLTEEK